MSKSQGNSISPLDIIQKDGAEILRLWTSSIDYTEDARLGEEILSRLREAYRKIRNTSRFLVGNLFDFSSTDQVGDEELPELDRWALARMAQTAQQVEEAYKQFEFHVVYHTIYNFAVVDLSSFYLDVLKDRLYISAADSTARRAAQTALFQVTDTLVRLLAPILPFTCEELWQNLYPKGGPVESVHLSQFSRDIHRHRDPKLLHRWEPLLRMRAQVSKALEESRQQKQIGNSLEALVQIRCGQQTLEYLKTFEDLRFLFIVSHVELIEAKEFSGEDLGVSVSKAPDGKCQRCWSRLPSVGTHEDLPVICSRCYSILQTQIDPN